MKSTWIRSPRFDMTWIIGPHFGAVAIALLAYPFLKSLSPMPTWVWFALVLCVDVAHVYSTLFRVYFDKNEKQRYSVITWLIPLVVWILGVIVYSFNSISFWRLLAYLAVFHFIRQQYGFFRIYSSSQTPDTLVYRWLNRFSIYYITAIPVLIWHFSGPKDFNWFISNDFYYIQSDTLVRFLQIVLAILVCGYVFTEYRVSTKLQKMNWPKNGIYLGTLLVWYLGIVHFDNDFIFTITNVIAHGVPYLALIWTYKSHNQDSYLQPWIRRQSLLLFLLSLVALAYVEEFLWSILIWKEHLTVFFLSKEQLFHVSPVLFTYLVPLLAVPQATHYILDAFIWKIRDSDKNQWMSFFKKTEV